MSFRGRVVKALSRACCQTKSSVIVPFEGLSRISRTLFRSVYSYSYPNKKNLMYTSAADGLLPTISATV